MAQRTGQSYYDVCAVALNTEVLIICIPSGVGCDNNESSHGVAVCACEQHSEIDHVKMAETLLGPIDIKASPHCIRWTPTGQDH